MNFFAITTFNLEYSNLHWLEWVDITVFKVLLITRFPFSLFYVPKFILQEFRKLIVYLDFQNPLAEDFCKTEIIRKTINNYSY